MATEKLVCPMCPASVEETLPVSCPLASPLGRREGRGGRISAGQKGQLAVVIHGLRFTVRSTDMAHKKIERKKELDRRRKRRAERIKARIHEAQAAAKSGK